MANILELASKISNINQCFEEANNNCSQHGQSLGLTNAIMTQVGFPDSPSSIDWSGLTDAMTADSGRENKSQLTSSPQVETQKYGLLPKENGDNCFDLYVKGFSNSPLASPGLVNIIDQIEKDNNISLSGSPDHNNLISTNSIFRNNSSLSEQLDNSISVHNISSSPQHSSFQSADSGVFSTTNDSSLLSNNSNLEAATADVSCEIDELKVTKTHKRPDASFVEMIARCILASRNEKVRLSDIYDYILKTYPYFEDAPTAWRISVRHHLSTCASFVKVGRVPLSRGFYWAIHSSCKEDFTKGIFNRKLIRKRIGNLKPGKRVRKLHQRKPLEAEPTSTESSVSSNVPILPKIDAPCVETAPRPVIHYSQMHTSANAYIDPVYSRLNGLSGEQIKSTIHGYPAYNYYNYLQANSLQPNSISNGPNSHYHVANNLSYYGNMPNYYYAENYYSNGCLQQATYNGANQYVSSPYEQHIFHGKTHHQSSSRYLPY